MVVVNYWAVLVAAVVSFVIGAAWYSPMLFAKQWMKAAGHTADGNKGGMGKSMVGMFISLLVTGYIIAHFANYAGAVTASGGFALGFWLWLGFIAMYSATLVFFERKSWSWYWLTNGYQFLSIVIMSMIIAAWR